jgi:fluoride ion exporter CrcB/FEX
MLDKDGLGAATLAALAALFSVLGASARVLADWQRYNLAAVLIGSFLANALSGLVIGLVLWEPLAKDHPTLLLAATAVGGWTGSLVLDLLARRWLLKKLRGAEDGK